MRSLWHEIVAGGMAVRTETRRRLRRDFRQMNRTAERLLHQIEGVDEDAALSADSLARPRNDKERSDAE
jgi:Mn-dependent DtxR family transcriptional regulator